MSSYTNQAAILGEIQQADLISLTDDLGQGQINTTVLNQIIANASGYIDSKVANLYGEQLPFAPAPASPSSVASMALTIACYRLFRRREVPDEKNKFTEAWEDVREFLDKVNSGDAHLDDIPIRDFPQVVATGRSTIYGGMGSNWPTNSM